VRPTDFTNQRDRLRRVVENALANATYESSREEDGRLLVLEARRRPDGKYVVLRFRGVRQSDATETPVSGSSLRLVSIGSAEKFSLLRLFFPFARAGSGAARVRIDAGAARLDIVCEDAEWWESDTPNASG
jgi:hypothetical protein